MQQQQQRQSSKKTVRVKIPEDKWRSFKAYAAEHGKGTQELAAEAIVEFLETQTLLDAEA